MDQGASAELVAVDGDQDLPGVIHGIGVAAPDDLGSGRAMRCGCAGPGSGVAVSRGRISNRGQASTTRRARPGGRRGFPPPAGCIRFQTSRGGTTRSEAECLADDLSHDLVGAAADRAEPRIAQGPLDFVLASCSRSRRGSGWPRRRSRPGPAGSSAWPSRPRGSPVAFVEAAQGVVGEGALAAAAWSPSRRSCGGSPGRSRSAGRRPGARLRRRSQISISRSMAPTAPIAISSRSQAKLAMISWKPSFSSPSRCSSGTSTSVKAISPVSEECQPSFSSFE